MAEEREIDYYKVVRFYQASNRGERVIIPRCTLKVAQDHCNDPESSSRTCTKPAGKARTRKLGDWFDGYRPVYKKTKRGRK